MAGSRKVLIIAVLVTVWCVAMVRRCGASDPAASSVAPATPVPRTAAVPVPAVPAPAVPAPAAPAPAAPAADASVVTAAPTPAPTPAPAPADDVDPVRDRVWAARMMVSPDGKQIFLPLSSADGARGEPNLVFEIWNRAGKPIRHLEIKSTEDYVGNGGAPGAAEKIRHQEQLAAAMLDELAAAGFTSSSLVEIQGTDPSSDGPGLRSHAELVRDGEHAPSLTIDLALNGVLTVKPRGHATITRRNAAWAGVPTPAQQRAIQKAVDAGENGCFNAAYLGGATVDLGHRFALVGIPYRGNDSCWEGDAASALITW